jgi:hypothetical protein
MATEEDKRITALEVYRKRLLEHREAEAKVKNCMYCLIGREVVMHMLIIYSSA